MVMNMTERLPYNEIPPVVHKAARLREKGRNPYDGLRPWSAITHGVGAALALVGTVALLSRAASPLAFAAFLVYGVSMVGLYTASTLYHCVNTSVKGRLALRKYDHTSIYYLIAGSYTPICLLGLPAAHGVPLLCVVWALALVGTAVSILWIDAPRWVTAGLYLFMGWLSIFSLPTLISSLSGPPLAWLVAGGLLYTVGGVLYAVKWPGRDNPRFGCHEIFHVFIVLGSAAHYVLMWGLA